MAKNFEELKNMVVCWAFEKIYIWQTRKSNGCE